MPCLLLSFSKWLVGKYSLFVTIPGLCFFKNYFYVRIVTYTRWFICVSTHNTYLIHNCFPTRCESRIQLKAYKHCKFCTYRSTYIYNFVFVIPLLPWNQWSLNCPYARQIKWYMPWYSTQQDDGSMLHLAQIRVSNLLKVYNVSLKPLKIYTCIVTVKYAMLITLILHSW